MNENNTADQSGADERAKFEAWCVTKYVIGSSTFKGTCLPNGKWYYFDDEIDCAWQALKAALASTQAIAGEAVTDDQIDEIWLNTKWDDLQPLRLGFNEVLRRRFARDLLKFAATSQGAKQ